MSVYHPVVEVLYGYESTNERGHSVIVQPREKYVLLCDKDDEWWYVGKDVDSDDGFYIPRTYVKVLQMQAARIPPATPQLVPTQSTLLNFNANSLETFRRPSANRQSAIVASSSNNNNNNNNSATLYSLATTSDAGADPGSLRRRTGPGFKLADPNRISRSIPVGLNFVHDIPTFNNPPPVVAAQHATNGFVDDAARSNTLERFNDAMDSFEKSTIHDKYTDVSSLEINVKRKQQQDEDLNNFKSSISNGNVPHRINDGPIYANLPPKSASDLPPVPSDMSNFVRDLQDGWKVYEDQFGRPYFHNFKSGVSTWKPPRVFSVCLKSDNNGTVFSSGDELDSSFSADDSDRHRFDLPPTPTRRSIIGRSFSIECRDQSIPEYGEESRTFERTNDKNNSFTESSTTTVAESRDDDNGESTTKSWRSAKPVLSIVNRSFGIPPQLPRRDTTKFSEDLASVAGSHSPDAMSAEVALFFQKGASFRRNSQTVIKSGFISKCKYAENGKRIKKQWISCFAYLTSAHIIFYKDEKSAEVMKKNNQYDAPLGVCDLRGAKLKWLEGDKTKRRHVFQLDLVEGSTYLFHLEENQEAVGWYQAVQQVIGRLPQPDFYPPPAVSDTSPKSTHARKYSGSGYSLSYKHSHQELERKPTTYAKDKKSSASSSISSTCDSHESQQSRETILNKLRRFFSIRPTIESLKEKGIYKPEPVFGSSLMDICARERSVVPKFIRICTALIEDKGLDNDGLYRMSGNLSQVQKIRCQVDQDKYTMLQNETDIHVLTGALKLFFRELPNPLFPLELTKDFLSAIRIQDYKPRLKKFRELIGRMPTPHRDCLDVLLCHLLRVADHAAQNRMQIHNLAIVFGPTLFSTDSNRTSSQDSRKSNKKGVAKVSNFPKMSAESIQSNSHLAFTMIMQGQIVEYMLKTHDRLFQNQEKPQLSQQVQPQSLAVIIGIGH